MSLSIKTGLLGYSFFEAMRQKNPYILLLDSAKFKPTYFGARGPKFANHFEQINPQALLRQYDLLSRRFGGFTSHTAQADGCSKGAERRTLQALP